MTIDERLDRLVERHEALAQSVELLAASARDLRAVAEATLVRQKDQRDRDAQYLRAISEVLKHWANGEAE